jgi:hypothetical protein
MRRRACPVDEGLVPDGQGGLVISRMKHQKGVGPKFGVGGTVMKAWICVASILACGSALAQKPAPEQPTRTAVKTVTFEALDRNLDRQISRTEAGYDRALSNGFVFLDANGDGFLSPEEYAARTKS